MTSTSVMIGAVAPARTPCESPDPQYRGLLRRLGWPPAGNAQAVRSLGVTGCSHGEGVTSVAVQLALAAATSADRSVLLVDGNLAQPGVAARFGVASAPGLLDAVTERPDCIPIEHPGGTPLAILPAGTRTGSMEAVYDSPSLADVLQDLKAEYDLVIVDLPPIDASHAAVRLGRLLDGVLLVVAAERLPWQHARRARDLLADAGLPLLGTVLNQAEQYGPRWLSRC